MIATAQAPGKLYLAGEYAITLPNQSAIVFAVDKYVTATVEALDIQEIQLNSDQLGKFTVSVEQLEQVSCPDDWELVVRTVQVLYKYHTNDVKNLSGIKVTLTSDLTFEGKKLGLGSSAAVVMSIIKAFHKLFDISATKEQQFKLGATIMLTLPYFDKGSMGDIAVATYGGMIVYRKFDDNFVKQLLQQHTDYQTIINTSWPYLEIKQLTWPSEWQLLVGWTGEVADTQKLLNAVSAEEQAKAKEMLALNTKDIIAEISLGINNKNYSLIDANIFYNLTFLMDYTQRVGINYLTENLSNAIFTATLVGIPAKVSGAGGGDNVIAVTDDAEKADQLRQNWRDEGIIPLPLKIASLGE